MKISFTVMAAAALLFTASSSMAQERAAGGTLDTQMTWTVLSDMAKAASDKATAVNTRVDQVVICGRKGMVYAPGQAGADVQGCYEPRTGGGVSLTTINNTLAGNTNVINAIITCNKSGMVYNGSACVAGSSAFKVSQVRGVGDKVATATCPAGTLLISCSGSRSPTFSDSCDEDECGFVGAGPSNANTCQTRIDTGKGTQATAWAFCLQSN